MRPCPTRFVSLLAGWTAAMLSAVAIAAGDPRWAVVPDPVAKTVKWPTSLSLSIEQPPRFEELLFPRSESEFVVFGLTTNDSSRGELWNVTTGKRTGLIKGKPPTCFRRALSPDGKYMALLLLDRARANDVEIWSMETGEQVATLTADDRTFSMTILDFAGPGELVTYTLGQQAGKFGHHLRIWDAATGKSLRQFDLEKTLSGDSRYDISPGGNWLVAQITPEVIVYDLGSGQAKGVITPPVKTREGKYVSIDCVRFSPHGKEIACLCDGSEGAVLTIYDVATGERKLTHDLPASFKSALQYAASYKGPHVEFVAEPPGFLYYGGGFIERETGLMLWRYQQGTTEFSHWKRLLTPAGLIVSTGGHDSRKLVSLAFPADQLRKSFEAYRGDVPALVKPGEKVKVAVKVDQVRYGKPAEAEEALAVVLAERLADDGLEADESGSTVMTVEYKEQAGKTLQEVKGGNIIGRGGVPTGRTVQSTSGEMTIKWASKDGKTKIYEYKLTLDPNLLMFRNAAEITDELARKQVFEIVKRQLAGLPMPYFVPDDKSLAVLPLTTSSQGDAPASGKDAIKKKINAKMKKVRK